MVGKYAIFFILAFATVQGTHTGFQSIDNYYEKEVIFGVWDTIKEIFENIKNAIGNLSENVQEIFKKLQDKINEVTKGLNLKEIIEKIIQKIKEVIGQVGERVKACVDEQRPAIEAIALESQTGTLKCLIDAHTQIFAIVAKVNELTAKGNELKATLRAIALKCIQDNMDHPANIIPCIKAQSETINESVAAMKEAAATIRAEAKAIAAQAVADLGSCMSAVVETANAKQAVVISEIKKCIAAQ